jgi:membrane protein DedA with SNARE-associated domain
MRKILGLISVTILFILTWAAGHDILSGEPNVWLEYSMVFLSLAIAGFGLIYEIRVLRKKQTTK